MTPTVMSDWQSIAVLAGSIVFLVFLFWRLRPVRKGIRTMGTAAKSALLARTKAREAKTPRAKAEVLCDAGSKASAEGSSLFPAVSLLLRALRTDPTWPEPIDRLRKLLWFQRPVALERILWKRLAVARWTGPQRPVAQSAAKALADLYSLRLRNRSRADVLARISELLKQPDQAPPDEELPKS